MIIAKECRYVINFEFVFNRLSEIYVVSSFFTFVSVYDIVSVYEFDIVSISIFITIRPVVVKDFII